MSRRAYGIVVGVIGSAVGAWWWSRYRDASTRMEARDKGTVIFHNTPLPTPLSGDGVI